MDLRKENWTENDYRELLLWLESVAQPAYRDFQSGLIPNPPPMLGIRIPVLRKMAAEISQGNPLSFLACADWRGNLYEETVLEGLVIGRLRLPYPEWMEKIRRFVSKIDNWAVNDVFCSSLKGMRKYSSLFWTDCDVFLQSPNPWEQRFGLVMLMSYYLEPDTIDAVLQKVLETDTPFYYVMMARAWLIATAFAKFREPVLRLLESRQLDAATQNKAIQKIRESFRVSPEDKQLVLSLKI